MKCREITTQDLVILLIPLVAAGILTIVAGCTALRFDDTEQVTATPIVKNPAFRDIVHKTNWMATLAVVGIALSAMAYINGNTKAVGIFVGSCVALGVSLAVARYASIIAIASLVAGGIVFLYSVGVKNIALKELISNIQELRYCYDADKRHEITKQLADKQSPTTRQLVKKIKVRENI